MISKNMIEKDEEKLQYLTDDIYNGGRLADIAMDAVRLARKYIDRCKCQSELIKDLLSNKEIAINIEINIDKLLDLLGSDDVRDIIDGVVDNLTQD